MYNRARLENFLFLQTFIINQAHSRNTLFLNMPHIARELLYSFSELASNETAEDDCSRIAKFETVPDEVSALSKKTGLVLTIFVLIYVPLCLLHFLRNRSQNNRLYKRNFTLLFLFSVGVMTYVILVPFREYYGPSVFPCDLYVVFAQISGSFILFPTVLRLMSLHYRVRFNKAIIDSTFDSLQKGNINLFADELIWKSSNGEQQIDALVNSNHLGVSGTHQTRSQMSMVRSLTKISTESEERKRRLMPYEHVACCIERVLDALISRVYWLSCWKGSKDIPEELKQRHFLASKSFVIIMFILLYTLDAILLGVYYSLIFAPGAGCTGCGILKLYPLQVPTRALGILISLVAIIRLWKYPDMLGIKQEILFFLALFVLMYVIFVPVLNAITGRLEETGEWNWSFISQISLLIGVTYSLPYQVWKAKKMRREPFKAKEELQEILRDEEGMKAFALHLASELSLENLYFYKTVTRWKEQYRSVGRVLSTSQALNLFDDYLRQESIFPVNVSFDAILNAQQGILNGCPDDVFDEVLDEVFKLMVNDSFHRFIKSAYYAAYKNDLL